MVFNWDNEEKPLFSYGENLFVWGRLQNEELHIADEWDNKDVIYRCQIISEPFSLKAPEDYAKYNLTLRNYQIILDGGAVCMVSEQALIKKYVASITNDFDYTYPRFHYLQQIGWSHNKVVTPLEILAFPMDETKNEYLYLGEDVYSTDIRYFSYKVKINYKKGFSVVKKFTEQQLLWLLRFKEFDEEQAANYLIEQGLVNKADLEM